jgi:hypothetical protein
VFQCLWHSVLVLGFHGSLLDVLLGRHKLLQRRLIVDDQGGTLQFDYVFLSKFRQCAGYRFPGGADELGNVFMG